MSAYKPVLERFWAKVDQHGPIPMHRPDLGPCWMWTAGISTDTGYGLFSDERRSRKISAHRFSYETHKGPIPEGLELDHLCRVRRCVNPDHLEAVTHQINVLRGESPSAHQAKRTSCVNGHPFTPENTYHIKGHRICKPCSIARVYASRGKPVPS
jgi:hypothetical protein